MNINLYVDDYEALKAMGWDVELDYTWSVGIDVVGSVVIRNQELFDTIKIYYGPRVYEGIVAGYAGMTLLEFVETTLGRRK